MTDKPKLVFSTGPFKDAIVFGHRTVEERDTEAGRSGITLEDADYSDLWRGGTDEIYAKWIPECEKLTGIKREADAERTAKAQARVKPDKNGNVKTLNPVLDSQVTYAEKVQAQVSDEVWHKLDGLFRELALTTPIDASPSKRTGSVSKANLEKADDILRRTLDKIEIAVGQLQAVVPDFDLQRDEEGKPERTSLARLVGAFRDAPVAGI